MEEFNILLFRFAVKFSASDNANVSLYPFGDEIYAFSETKMLQKINTEDLSTENQINLNKHIAILHNSSHPHVMKDGKYVEVFSKHAYFLQCGRFCRRCKWIDVFHTLTVGGR